MSNFISRPTSGYGGLTQAEQDHNAWLIYGQLSYYGYTLNAVCGVLGNMWRESGLNPQAWEKRGDYNKGFGLVQWTPATNFTIWARKNKYDPNDGYSQLARINYEYENHIQYYKTSDYPLTFSEFQQSTESPEYLVRAWFANYERGSASQSDLQGRIVHANYYYELFSGLEPPSPDDPDKSKVPAWLLMKMADNG